jgi:hypothetical protein
MISLQRYKLEVEKSLRNDLSGVKVIDLYALPDYKDYLSQIKDPDFAYADKMEYTQHDWLFKKVHEQFVYSNYVF